MPFVGHADLRFEPLPPRAADTPVLRDLWELRPTWPAALCVALALVCFVVMDGPAWLGDLGVLNMPLCTTATWNLAAFGGLLAMWLAMLAVLALAEVGGRFAAARRIAASSKPRGWTRLLPCCDEGVHAPLLLGQMTLWVGVALGLTALNLTFAQEGLLGSNTALHWPWGALWLGSLGVWQLLPMQRRLHIAALTPVPSTQAVSSAVAFKSGLAWAARHAAVHAAPLLAMFGLGVMQMLWMGVHMAQCACDAAWPKSRLIRARAIGLVWLVLAAAPALRLS